MTADILPFPRAPVLDSQPICLWQMQMWVPAATSEGAWRDMGTREYTIDEAIEWLTCVSRLHPGERWQLVLRMPCSR